MKLNKAEILLKQPQKIFRTADLEILWAVNNKNTLYQTIQRMIKKGSLIPLQKGLYSLLPLNQLDPVELGFRIINQFCYLSTESILSQAGTINQPARKITFVSATNKNISLGSYSFLSRQMKDQLLHNPAGIIQRKDGVLIASLERAVVDMLYFQPNYHFDAPNSINWEQVQEIKKQLYDN